MASNWIFYTPKFLPKNLFILMSIFLTSACLSVSYNDEASFPKIYAGQKVGPSHPVFLSTVALVEDKVGGEKDGFVYCSGVLVAPSKIITAAHCIEKNRKVRVMFPGHDDRPKVVLAGVGEAHEDYGKDYNEAFSFDLGIITLAEKAPRDMKPVPIGRGDAYKVGDQVVIAGFGYTSSMGSANQLDKTQSELNMTTTKLADVFKRGDEEARDDYENWGLISYASEKDTGACAGDSGGPMFVSRNGSFLVIGIGVGGLSGGVCGREGKYTHLDFYRPWLLQKIPEIKK